MIVGEMVGELRIVDKEGVLDVEELNVIEELENRVVRVRIKVCEFVSEFVGRKRFEGLRWWVVGMVVSWVVMVEMMLFVVNLIIFFFCLGFCC